MQMIKLNLDHCTCKEHVFEHEQEILAIHQQIHEKKCLGNDFLGWLNYPNEIDFQIVENIKKMAQCVQQDCDILVVIGIGGSYLGAKAGIDAINGLYPQKKLEIVYVGNTLSPTYTAQLYQYLKGKKIALNVISKSGTTIESAIAFRIIQPLVEKAFKEKANEYIFVTTDKQKGALKQIALEKNYPTFIIPSDIGGRYSVFTPVGLFPMACAGIDIDALIQGAQAATQLYGKASLKENTAYQYAMSRFLCYQKGFPVEFFITYEPHFQAFNEWLKQLFGESEGKEQKGILPHSLCFTTELLSMGQFYQQGNPIFFETTIRFAHYQQDLLIPTSFQNLDQLDDLIHKPLSYVNDIAIDSTIEAHFSGNKENLVLEVLQMDAYHLGELFYFFMKACACSALLLKVNPFNQPGVEVYKANMKERFKK